MKYVIGITKRFSYTKSENHTKRGRKHYFCYEYSLESGKFKRVRISTIKAIYYKITFIFGLKARRKEKNVKCEYCGNVYDVIVTFWDRGVDCPYC